MRDLSRMIRETAVILLDRADKLEDAHCEEQFNEIAADLKEQSRRLDRLAGKVHPIRSGEGNPS